MILGSQQLNLYLILKILIEKKKKKTVQHIFKIIFSQVCNRHILKTSLLECFFNLTCFYLFFRFTIKKASVLIFNLFNRGNKSLLSDCNIFDIFYKILFFLRFIRSICFIIFKYSFPRTL